MTGHTGGAHGEHSVRRHLRLEIADYDATIRRWIPGYDTMLSVAAAAVAAVAPARVLDLGAGTGALSQAILSQAEFISPGAPRVELVDIDPQMLAQARVRLESNGDRVRFHLRSFAEPLEPADAVAASLALHHIPTLEARSALFGRVFAALPPGGVFVNADVRMPAAPEQRARLFRYWADHQVAHGIAEDDAWRHFREWADEDVYLPLDDELAALASIGFDATQVWSAGPIGVVVARR